MPITPNDAPTPLMSFIITCYNLPAHMLIACLDSISQLTLKPDEREIILIDDGSALPAIGDIGRHMDNIIYLRQPNRGVACARNMGLRIATGQFIHFVDGDDYLIRTPYEHCLDLVRYHQPDVVVFDMTNHMSVPIPYAYKGPMSGTAYVHNHNLRGTICSYIFSRQTMGNLRFTPGTLHEDEEFIPQLLLRAERIYQTEAKAYFYRQRSHSITHESASEHIDKRLADALAIILRLQQLAQTLSEAERAAMNRRIAQLTMDYIYNTIHLTHDRKRLNEALDRLSSHGLYPLPNKHYTHKYSLFRSMIQTAMGRRLLFHLIR